MQAAGYEEKKAISSFRYLLTVAEPLGTPTSMLTIHLTSDQKLIEIRDAEKTFVLVGREEPVDTRIES